MILSDEYIKKLQAILKGLELNYTDEQTREAGMAIMCFVIAKAQRNNLITKNMEIVDEIITI